MHDRPRVRYFSDVPIPGSRRRTGAGILAIRIAEVSRFLVDRYGETLPNDDAGRDEAFVMANHLARTSRGDRAIGQWLALRAPWMSAAEVDEITAAATRLQLKWTADRLAQRIGLDFATRARLRIKTIGAVDVDKAERAKRRAQQKRDAQARRRRDKTALSRRDYPTVSASVSRPWEAQGISERTWYRRKAELSVPRAQHIGEYILGTLSLPPEPPNDEGDPL